MKKIFWILYGKVVKTMFLNNIALRYHCGDSFTDEEIKILSKVLKTSVDTEFSKKIEAA